VLQALEDGRFLRKTMVGFFAVDSAGLPARGQQLDGHAARIALVLGQVDRGAGAFAQDAFQSIGAQPGQIGGQHLDGGYRPWCLP
jgi:hypothetical protein